jgi:Uma2 family endonuclease
MELQQKMELYIQNGVKLGWLIDMEEEKIYVYQLGQDNPVYVVENFTQKLSGEPILEGFELDLKELKALKEEEME